MVHIAFGYDGAQKSGPVNWGRCCSYLVEDTGFEPTAWGSQGGNTSTAERNEARNIRKIMGLHNRDGNETKHSDYTAKQNADCNDEISTKRLPKDLSRLASI